MDVVLVQVAIFNTDLLHQSSSFSFQIIVTADDSVFLMNFLGQNGDIASCLIVDHLRGLIGEVSVLGHQLQRVDSAAQAQISLLQLPWSHSEAPRLLTEQAGCLRRFLDQLLLDGLH